MAKRPIQTLKGLVIAISANGNSLKESINLALWLLRCLTLTTRNRTPFEKHYSQQIGKLLANTFTKPILLSNWDSICFPKIATNVPVNIMRDGIGKNDWLQTDGQEEENTCFVTVKRCRLKNHQVSPRTFHSISSKRIISENNFNSKFKPLLQRPVTETQLTVLTKNNRRQHKNQLLKPLPFQPHCSYKSTLSFQREQSQLDNWKCRTGKENEEECVTLSVPWNNDTR